MTHLALHDPGVLSHVLVADGTLWVRDLGILYQILHDFFNCESSSSTIYQIHFVCLSVCVCVYKVEIYLLKVHQPTRAQFET